MPTWRSLGSLLVVAVLLFAGAYEVGHTEDERVLGGLLLGAGLVLLGAWLSSEIREELRDADLERARKARKALQVEVARQIAADAATKRSREMLGYTGDGVPDPAPKRPKSQRGEDLL